MQFFLENIMRSLVIAFTTISLCGCSMEVPSGVTQKQPVVYGNEFYAEFSIEAVDDMFLQTLHERYVKNGYGPVNLIVTFNPDSSPNSALKAQANLDKVKSGLYGLGISHVNGDIVPVKGLSHNSNLVVAYNELSVGPPENCKTMPGYGPDSPTGTGAINDYEFGCQTETIFAQQAARPSDLLGNEAAPGPGYSTRTFRDTSGYYLNAQHAVIQDLSSQGTTN